MLRDLEKELSSYAAERQRKRSSAATGGGGGSASVPKSLWEELYDIGEEFVEFLEQVGASRGCWWAGVRAQHAAQLG